MLVEGVGRDYFDRLMAVKCNAVPCPRSELGHLYLY